MVAISDDIKTKWPVSLARLGIALKIENKNVPGPDHDCSHTHTESKKINQQITLYSCILAVCVKSFDVSTSFSLYNYKISVFVLRYTIFVQICLIIRHFFGKNVQIAR